MLDITELQKQASNPTTSVWVNASAGSGKTKVLTDRFINLLLNGTEPERILCLTFTKSAASEMANRIRDILRKWADLPQEELKKEIQSISNMPITSEVIEKAHTLFQKVLNASNGLKIMTIHAFCTFLLKHFPLEANISPNFDVMDEQQSKTILKQSILKTFTQPQFKATVRQLSLKANEETLHEIFEELISKRSYFSELKLKFKNENDVLNAIKKYLKVDSYHSENQIISSFCSPEEWPTLKKQYLTQQETIRKSYSDTPEAYEVFEVLEKLKNFKTFQKTKLLITLVYTILDTYTQQKRYLGLMDYDDLIEITKHLLSQSSMASWILYKLDKGIDHILLDEAQDTNPSQWKIVSLLTEEFFSGQGASDDLRTFFVVGDKKQSIYSFQQVQAKDFEIFKEHFEEKITSAHLPFQEVPLNISFRSTPAVLELVNKVFSNPKARRGVALDSEDITHIPFREYAGGCVEIWPVIEAEEKEKMSPWELPDFQAVPVSSKIKVAKQIAQKIHSFLQNKEILESRGTPITPKDILILVRKRTDFVEILIKALKEKNLPVAGMDKLQLTDNLAVKDLIALGKFFLLPEDDLNLACLLKSPFINLTEEELLNVALAKNEESLFQAFLNTYPQKADILNSIFQHALEKTPFEFFAFVLKSLNFQQQFSLRFGDEINEILDEFLTICLNFEEKYTPVLSEFIYWLEDKEITVKRDLDQGDTEQIRIMTVHSSKGLQGNIVFLPDTCQAPNFKEKILWTENLLPLWYSNESQSSRILLDLKDKYCTDQEEEYKRLLYVALTRARDRLYISGFQQKRKSSFSWYSLIDEATSELEKDENGIKKIVSPQLKKEENKKSSSLLPWYETIPSWAYTNAKAEFYSKKINPSSAEEEFSFSFDLFQNSQNDITLKQGIFIHKLLQELPSVPKDKRRIIAQKLCPENLTVPEEVFTLLETPLIPSLFSKNSFAEIPIVGTVNNEKISGQIDRLVIEEDKVILVDFKYTLTQNTVVSKKYYTQMNLYKQLLNQIFKNKPIKAYIYWLPSLTITEILP